MRLSVPLLCGLLAAPAFSQDQFFILLSDLQQMECWNETCTVESAQEWVEVQGGLIPQTCSWVLSGSPPAYQFSIDSDLDEWICGQGLLAFVRERRVVFQGIGFHRVVDVEYSDMPFPCGLPFPQRLIPSPGSGCVDENLAWTWANFPAGVVPVGQDKWIDGPWTVEAGLRIECAPGVGIHVGGDGHLEVAGRAEAPVIFTGQGWDGIQFMDQARGTLRHCRISDVDHDGDGGALRLSGTSHVWMDRSLVHHNRCAGDGAAGLLEEGASLFLNSCTVAWNSGAATGGFELRGGQALLESNLSLITHADPPASEVRGSGITNLQVTNVYPQREQFPDGRPPTFWNCDPGYLDAAGGDFHISYWSPDGSRNCVVDASIIETELDPDGTPGDMGVFPFDQRNLLLPPRNLSVEDEPGDQGGRLWLGFQASPQDGGDVNPPLGYSVWLRPPGAPVDQPWIALGFLPALGSPEARHRIPVDSWDVCWEGQLDPHHFRVAAHAPGATQPAFAPEVEGCAEDDLAPAPPSGLACQDVLTYWIPQDDDFVDVWWDPLPEEDVAAYELWVRPPDDPEGGWLEYLGSTAGHQVRFPAGLLLNWDQVVFEVRAADTHGNHGLFSRLVAEVTVLLNSTGVEPLRPTGLQQVWPNPFNPLAHIRYHLAQPGPVRLTIWNLAGQRVAVLQDGLQAAGDHEALFDAGGLAAGVYIHRLEAGGATWTGRLLLLK